MKNTLSTLLLILSISLIGQAQNNPYLAPLYWSVYEHHIEKEYAGVSDNFIPESELRGNINWVDNNLKDFGYNMICMDGWGDVSQLNENGYRRSHSMHWEHDFAWWSDTLQSIDMTLGMYGNPLWIHVDPNDTQTLIAGTPLPVSSLIDESEESLFTWVQVDRPGAEQYVKGSVQYYADMGIEYFRVDFLSWYETGYDHWMGTVGPARPREYYETALRWMREACDENGMFLSLVMPNLFNEGEFEREYGHMIRINADAGQGTWYRFSENHRGVRFNEWSQYENTMDGFAYWASLSGRDSVILDGDFIRLNTYETDSEKRTVISSHIIAGGPVSITDQHSTIGEDTWLYQNQELLDLHLDGFVGQPLSNDPTEQNSQIWTGQLSGGEWVLALFNREDQTLTRQFNFSNLNLSSPVAVRDLWQHADLGMMDSLSIQIPPHGTTIVKLNETPLSCLPQTVSFDPIPNQQFGTTTVELIASANSGLPIRFEVALGPALIIDNALTLTGADGRVTVMAYQAGNDMYCAAIPQMHDFEVTGGHQTEMHVAGDFSDWNLSYDMEMLDQAWVIHDVSLDAGAHQMKFANTSNWSGDDWGNSNGTAGIAQLTTGGGANINFTISEVGRYTFSFNDISLVYSIIPSEPQIVHQEQMFVAGTFSEWSPSHEMTLIDDIWVVEDVVIYPGDHELKFVNTNNWTGDDWGNSTGLSGFAQLTTGGDPNITFTIDVSAYIDIYFDDVSLEYSIGNGLEVEESGQRPVQYRLAQNYPNPFNPETIIEYEISEQTLVKLTLYDALGREVMQLANEIKPAGLYSLKLSGSALSSGVYFYVLEAGSYKQYRKMIILR